MIPFLVHHYCRQRVDRKMLVRHFGSGGKEVSMRLIVLRHRMIGVPQSSFLFAHKCEKYVVSSLQHVDALGTGDGCDRRTGHTGGERQKLFFGPIAGVDELLVSLDATIKETQNRYITY